MLLKHVEFILSSAGLNSQEVEDWVTHYVIADNKKLSFRPVTGEVEDGTERLVDLLTPYVSSSSAVRFWNEQVSLVNMMNETFGSEFGKVAV